MKIIIRAAALVAAAAMPTASALAAPAPNNAEAFLPIWPAKPPGPDDWPVKEVQRYSVGWDGRRQLEFSDVAYPALMVVKPAKDRANGAGVIVLPGGAFMALAWDKEGLAPARWLAGLGYTAFVLKYRVRTLPFPSDAELGPQPGAFYKGMAFLAPNVRVAVADGQQAVRYVREHAEQYGIRSNRVGMLGFSAGATTTMDVILEGDTRSRPDFAAAIYGAMGGGTPPRDGPPVFIAAAQDDDIVPVEQSTAIFSAWHRAGLDAELHVYRSGGHGFGLGRPGTAPRQWPEAFARWLSLLPQNTGAANKPRTKTATRTR